MIVLIFFLKNSVSKPSSVPAGTTVVTETETIPVTDNSGETVTNENGEQLFDTVTVTKTQTITTTEKQGFLDKIFNNETENNTASVDQSDIQASSEEQTEETTQKQSWFDKLFGNKETQTQDSTTSPVTTTPDENNLQPTTEPLATVPATEISPEDISSQEPASSSQPGISTEENISSSESTQKESITSTTNLGSTTEPVTATRPSASTSEATSSEATSESNTTTAPEQEDDFTYTIVDGSIKLLSYTGNSSVIRIPAEIDGKHVAYLGSNVFSDKSSITSIIFEGSTSGSEKFYLPSNTVVFNSLPNLTSVTFPFETNNYFLNSDGSVNYTYSFGSLFSSCPKVSAINFGEHLNSMLSPNMSRMFSTDGVVFVNTSSEISLIWYPTAKTQSDYIVPDNVRKIEKNAFFNNPYIESITFSSKVSSILGPNFRNCTKLYSFAVADGNTKLSTVDGVLIFPGFSINNEPFYGAFYPPAKPSTAFSFPSDKNMYIDANTFCGNPYLKEFTFYEKSRIDGAVFSSDARPINLEKIIATKNCLIPSTADKYYTIEYID